MIKTDEIMTKMKDLCVIYTYKSKESEEANELPLNITINESIVCIMKPIRDENDNIISYNLFMTNDHIGTTTLTPEFIIKNSPNKFFIYDHHGKNYHYYEKLHYNGQPNWLYYDTYKIVSKKELKNKKPEEQL